MNEIDNENYLTKLCVTTGIARPCGRQYDSLYGEDAIERAWGAYFGTLEYPRGRDGVSTSFHGSLKESQWNRKGKGVKFDLLVGDVLVDVKDKDPTKWGKWGLEVTLLGSPNGLKKEGLKSLIQQRGYNVLFVWKDEGGDLWVRSMDVKQYCLATSFKAIALKKGGLELKARDRDAFEYASSKPVKLTGLTAIDSALIMGCVDHLRK